MEGNDMKKNSKKSLYLIIGAVALLALPLLAQMITGNEYWVLILCTMLIYVIAVSGLDILFGYSGQISELRSSSRSPQAQSSRRSSERRSPIRHRD